MIRKFEDITVINNKDLYDKVSAYGDALIDEATANGALAEQDADNEYTREIGRVGVMCADYESAYMTFEYLKFKSPLVIGIQKGRATRSLKRREAAEMLDI